jgi:hypothetical protein
MPPADRSTGAYRRAAPCMPQDHGQPLPLTRSVRSRALVIGLRMLNRFA